MINIARHHHGPPATMVIRANATSMPLRTGTADAVVATFPTRYIYETAVLDDVRRVLKPHGRLVVIMTGGGCSQPPGVAAEHAPGHRPATANRRSPHSAS